MADLLYDTSAIEAARTAAAGEAGRLPGLVDGVAAVPGTAFGALGASAALAGAVTTLRQALVTDLQAGGTHLQEVDRALDATIQAMQGTDRAAGDSLTPAGT